MEGKTLLVLGWKGYGMKKLWADLKGFGLKIILVDKGCKYQSMMNVDHFIDYNYDDTAWNADEHADMIINLVSSYRTSTPDGVLSFFDRFNDIIASIQRKLHLPSLRDNVLSTVKNKYECLRILHECPDITLFSSKVVKCNNRSEIETGLDQFSFPLIMKPIFGTGSNCVRLIENTVDGLSKYDEIDNTMKERQAETPTMILMDFFSGSYHRVDIVTFEGRVLHAIVSDVAPSTPKVFRETVHCFPSRLAKLDQFSLSSAAVDCCQVLGLTHGVYNVEIALTQIGPKIIEINGRMCRIDRKDYIKQCFNVDLLQCACSIALSLKPPTQEVNLKTGATMAAMCYPSLHAERLEEILFQRILMEDEDKHGCKLVKNYPPDISSSPDDITTDKPYSAIAIYTKSFETTQSTMLQLLRELQLDSSEYCISDYVKFFE